MEPLSSIFIILAGIIYVLWQVHKESKGLISAFLVIAVPIVCFCFGTKWLFEWLGDVLDYETLILVAVLYFLIYIGAFIYFVARVVPNMGKKAIKEYGEIWNEISKMPQPTQEDLLERRKALGLPLWPVDSEHYNGIAYNDWRTEQYNKKLKERNKIVIY